MLVIDDKGGNHLVHGLDQSCVTHTTKIKYADRRGSQS
jgi:hypothetical protein